MARKSSKLVSATRFEALENRQMFATGVLDPSFGTAGKANPDLGFVAVDVAVQSDGKIVAIGNKSGEGWMIARLNANGSLDSTFGDGDGLQSVSLGARSWASQVVVQPDGKIVVGGIAADTSSVSNFFDLDMFGLVRLNASGSLDKTFSGDGKTKVVGGREMDKMGDMALQPDGKIVMVAGDEDFHFLPTPHIESNFVIARVLANGSLDAGFGTLRVGGSRTGWTPTDMGGFDVATSVFIQPNGKIVVGGTKRGNDSDHIETPQFLVARYNANGTLDNSFDGNGKLATYMNGNNSDELHSVVVQSDGKIVAGGMARNHFGLVRYNVNGSIDATFGGGKVYTKLSERHDILESLFIDQQGRITAVGTADRNFNIGQVGKKLAAVQYTSAGVLDTSFGTGGIANFETGNIMAKSAAKTTDGKIVIAGQQNGTTLIRFSQTVAGVEVFSLDPNASETGANPASFIFTRDQRLTYPTRIYYTLGGSASGGSDYPGINIRAIPRSVEIPAGQTYAVVTINPIDDARLEPTETIVATITTDQGIRGPIGGGGVFNGGGGMAFFNGGSSSVVPYQIGVHSSQTLEITDNDTARVNFQPAGSALVSGYVPDVGSVFGDRGLGMNFGWDADNSANTRDRNNPASTDQRFDTLNHMQKLGENRKWEMAVQNGWYDVRLVAGDPSNFDGKYKINVENKLALNITPDTTHRLFDTVTTVNVTDGKLTISNAGGATNNKVCFLEVTGRSAPANQTQAFNGTAKAPSNGIASKQLSSLFSSKEIDQLLASI